MAGRPPVAVRAAGVDMPSGGRRVGVMAAEVRQMSLMYATCAVHEYVKLLPCETRPAVSSGHPSCAPPNVLSPAVRGVLVVHNIRLSLPGKQQWYRAETAHRLVPAW